MREAVRPRVAIVDYGMGNLFSVKQACEHVGMHATVTSSKDAILAAEAVILPGVGAFGDAMETLRKLGLVGVLRDIAVSETPLFGICLGMQLLMSESYEFGHHRGLEIIEGEVIRLEEAREGRWRLKVPHVGWNRISQPRPDSWRDSWLDGLDDGEFMYFVHSFYPKPADQSLVRSMTRYGHAEFCSSLQRGNVFACQFHPERSGRRGLRIYQNLAVCLAKSTKEA